MYSIGFSPIWGNDYICPRFSSNGFVQPPTTRLYGLKVLVIVPRDRQFDHVSFPMTLTCCYFT